MLSPLTVAMACVCWLLSLFALARWAQRYPPAFARHWWLIYGLSLAIHCTSWTFYGTVTQAARSGWWIPPTFIGAILLYTLGLPLMRRLVDLGRRTHATSVADLIATRLGKSAPLAAVVTLVMVIGMVPYIALQLRAVSGSFSVLMSGNVAARSSAWYADISLYGALAMALFAMAFGTREANASAHNRGMVVAIAFESLFKLMAMLLVGIVVIGGAESIPDAAQTLPERSTLGFGPLIILGAMAMFVQPHQFHMAVVEARDERDTVKARWVLPAYLALIALPILPIALIGLSGPLASTVAPDLFVLALPLHAGHDGVALLAFLGGLGAATGMVVVSVLSLSLMIINHWVSPSVLRGSWWTRPDGDLRRDVVLARRAAVLVVMALSWAFARAIDNNAVLADVGALSFSAMVPVVPVLLLALWRPQVAPQAACIGIVAGLLVWAWLVLLPNVMRVPAFPSAIEWLHPNVWFGLNSWSPLGRGLATSLLVSYGLTIGLSGRFDALQRRGAGGLQVRTLRELASRFLPPARVQAVFEGLHGSDAVPAEVGESVEAELSQVLGSASANILLEAAHNRQGLGVEQVARIVDESRVGLRFNQQLLEAALSNMSQGISVVDRNLRLVAWNPRYAELFGFSDALLRVGRPIEDLTREALQASHGLSGSALDAAVERRLAYMRAGTLHLTERVFPDGSMIEIRGTPMPGGGFVATYTDVTQFRQAQRQLALANETLETRVAERTEMLQHAKREAELANEAKTRFMTAVGHDLMQPLHAAQLFTDGLESMLRRKDHAEADPLGRVREVRGALDSTTELLQSLLDIAKLKSGGLTPALRTLPSRDVTDPLAAEFSAIAKANGLEFVYRPSEEWIRTDPTLLRRVLQNFLANATRYAGQGTVSLLATTDTDGTLQLAVHDQGPGIPEQDRTIIFDEFRRGEGVTASGLGLGLSIAKGLSDLLEHELLLHTETNRGTTFAVRVSITDQLQQTAPSIEIAEGARILLVDNDQPTREQLTSMLQEWGHDVSAFDGTQIEPIAQAALNASVWLLDFHLDDGRTGIDVYRKLIRQMPDRPTLVLTADISDQVRSICQELDLTLVRKPIRALALRSVLMRLLSASNAARP